MKSQAGASFVSVILVSHCIRPVYQGVSTGPADWLKFVFRSIHWSTHGHDLTFGESLHIEGSRTGKPHSTHKETPHITAQDKYYLENLGDLAKEVV